MTRPILLALALAAAAGVLGPWLDGQPSEADVSRAVAADATDAQTDARKAANAARAEAAMQRANAQLIAATHSFNRSKP